jgi:hypothetical protein
MRKPPPAPYLNDRSVDDLARMVTALLSELWIVRDRMAILEDALTKKRVLAEGEIEAYAPDPALEAELERLRDTMVAKVAGAPFSRLEAFPPDVVG